MVVKESLLTVLAIVFVLFSVYFVSAIEFNGTVFNITGSRLEGALVNVTVRKSAALFQGTGGDTGAFQMNATCACGASRCCGNWTAILAAGWYSNWTDITTSDKQIVDRLNFTDGSDSVRIEIRINVPSDEPSGTRSSTLTFTATVGE
mgnify:CR=1 FL=1